MARAKATSEKPAATGFDYDAVKGTGRRKTPRTKLHAEHVILPQSKRKKLLATTKDQVRNASILAWMIRRHLDYISRFRFDFRHPNKQITTLVNRLFDWHAQPRNFDVSARFGREEMFRMFEMEKVVAGDAALVKLANGKVQSIESDLIALPSSGKFDYRKKQHDPIPDRVKLYVDKDCGVIFDPENPNRISEFCICSRGVTGKTLTFDHLEPSENVIFDGYWTRFSSQVRGVSPLSTAVSMVQDVYENMDYALAKSKVHQLFGLALMRDYSGADNDQEEIYQMGAASGVTTGADEAADDASTETEDGTKTISAAVQDIEPSEMLMIDMDTKGRIDTIESKTPSSEFQNFMEAAIRMTMIALDIPYTAYNSRASNFSGLIADQNMYEVSCRWKREKNMWARLDYSDWLIDYAWDSTDWNLSGVAEKAGIKTKREIKELIEWVPTGSPWLQKLQEVQGDTKAIAIGLDNPIDACKRRGGDVFKNIDKTAQVYEYAKSKGVTLMIGDPGQSSIEEKEATVAEVTGENEDE